MHTTAVQEQHTCVSVLSQHQRQFQPWEVDPGVSLGDILTDEGVVEGDDNSESIRGGYTTYVATLQSHSVVVRVYVRGKDGSRECSFGGSCSCKFGVSLGLRAENLRKGVAGAL